LTSRLGQAVHLKSCGCPPFVPSTTIIDPVASGCTLVSPERDGAVAWTSENTFYWDAATGVTGSMTAVGPGGGGASYSGIRMDGAGTVTVSFDLASSGIGFPAGTDHMTFRIRLSGVLIHTEVVALTLDGGLHGDVFRTYLVSVPGVTVQDGDILTATYQYEFNAALNVFGDATGGLFLAAAGDLGTAVTNSPNVNQPVGPELAGTGDGSTTVFQTNFPYQPESPLVFVGGIEIVPVESGTGEITLPFPPPLGASVVVYYLAGAGGSIGAGNPIATATSGPTPRQILGSGSDGSGDNVLHDDGTWSPETGGTTIEVDDEGTPLTTAVASFDFVGAGVTATAVGDAVTVTIDGSGGMTPYYIAAGATFTVPLYRQALFAEAIEVDGGLVVNGLLIGVD
jgi:hypothetical protein